MDAAKQKLITTKILALVADGVPVREAFDRVCGAGSSARLIDAIWESAQRR